MWKHHHHHHHHHQIHQWFNKQVSRVEEQCCRLLGSNDSFHSILVESVTDMFKLQSWFYPIPSMYGIFTYIWWIFMVNVGNYTVAIPYMDGMGWVYTGSGRLFVHYLAERLQGKLKPCRLLGKATQSTLREPRTMWSSTCRGIRKKRLQKQTEKMNCLHQKRLQRCLTSFSIFSDMLCANSMTVGITTQMPFLHIRVGSRRHYCTNAIEQ